MIRGELSLYDSFNARNLSAEEVAERFICNEDFEDLCSNDHAVLFGPRGSGKTTLLKMLTLDALNKWAKISSKGKSVYEHIPFLAVYIPSDIQWKKQLDNTANFYDERWNKIFSNASLTINILINLLSSIETYIRLKLKNSLKREENEVKFCRQCIKILGLDEEVPSISFVRNSLSARIGVVQEVFSRVNLASRKERLIDKLPSFFHFDYLSKAESICSYFEEVYKCNIKWALCFDELELAPKWFQEKLYSELRSTYQRFLFKIGTSPIPSYISGTQARPRHDFREIPLWPHKRKNINDFTSALARSILLRSNYKETDPGLIFGYSYFSAKGIKGVYKENSFIWKKIKDEARQDRGLRMFLLNKKIDPDNPFSDNQHLLDTVLRKIKPIVLFRSTYRSWYGEKIKRRSRKASELFFGFDVISDISDGNPRWLIGIMKDMLLKSRGKVRVAKEIQRSVLDKVSKDYCALLKVIPNKQQEVNGKTFHLVTLLNQIASYFHSKLIRDHFSLEPITSFVVDKDVPSNLHDFLKLASYHGAIIQTDTDEGLFNSELEGRRFRLTYMLAPVWKLPLRLYKSIDLSSCLDLRTYRKKKELKGKKSQFQYELFK
ncbi:MAG: hypothetical protein WC695_01275 [Candidatus Omnitrophota bacterium]